MLTWAICYLITHSVPVPIWLLIWAMVLDVLLVAVVGGVIAYVLAKRSGA